MRNRSLLTILLTAGVLSACFSTDPSPQASIQIDNQLPNVQIQHAYWGGVEIAYRIPTGYSSGYGFSDPTDRWLGQKNPIQLVLVGANGTITVTSKDSILLQNGANIDFVLSDTTQLIASP